MGKGLYNMNQTNQADSNLSSTGKMKLKPEEMLEYKDDQLAQYLIKGWRMDFPGITDEKIVEELEFWL